MIQLLTLILCFTACSSYKDITRGTELTEDILRAQLLPGKKYTINLNAGPEIMVRITHVDSKKVYGKQTFNTSKHKNTETPFSDSYSNLHRNANRIAVEKFNPILTGGCGRVGNLIRNLYVFFCC